MLVRGRFDELDQPTRARLLAEAAGHSVADAAFTESGTLTYDRALSSFGFRIQVRARGGDAEGEAVAQAEQAVRAALADMGAGCRDLRTSTSDMAAVWQRQGGGSRGGSDGAAGRDRRTADRRSAFTGAAGDGARLAQVSVQSISRRRPCGR